MRYISHYKNLVLISPSANVSPPVNDVNPIAVYSFYDGVLIVGDPTSGSGTGNAIDPTKCAELYPNASTDLEKVGLGTIFFEAPVTDVSSASPQSGEKYLVLSGAVTYNGVTYGPRQVISIPSSDSSPSFSDAGTNSTIALDISNFPVEALPYRPELSKLIEAAFKLAHLTEEADEAEWDYSNWRARTPLGRDPWTWTR